MKRTALSLFAFVVCLCQGGAALAQINVSTSGQEVRIGKDGSVKARAEGASAARGGNEASVTVGGIAEDANIEGITVINGRVSIDGKEVPPNVSRYKSPKTGKVYVIQRKGGSVSVSEAGEGK